MDCKRSIIFYLFVLLSLSSSGQSLCNDISIDDSDEVYLHYQDDRTYTNMIDDMYGIRIKGDTLNLMKKLLSNASKDTKLEYTLTPTPYMYLSIKKANKETHYISFDSRTARYMDPSTDYFSWKFFEVKREDRAFLEALRKKMKTEYTSKYARYSHLPICSSVHSSPWFYKKNARVIFYILKEPCNIVEVTYLVHLKRKGKLRVYRYVEHNRFIKCPENITDTNSIRTFLRSNKLYYPNRSSDADALDVILKAFPSWNGMTEKERMDILDDHVKKSSQ